MAHRLLKPRLLMAERGRMAAAETQGLNSSSNDSRSSGMGERISLGGPGLQQQVPQYSGVRAPAAASAYDDVRVAAVEEEAADFLGAAGSGASKSSSSRSSPSRSSGSAAGSSGAQHAEHRNVHGIGGSGRGGGGGRAQLRGAVAGSPYGGRRGSGKVDALMQHLARSPSAPLIPIRKQRGRSKR